MFLGVLLDQHFKWKEHIKLTENKITKTWVYYIKQDLMLIKEPCYASTTHIFTPAKTTFSFFYKQLVYKQLAHALKLLSNFHGSAPSHQATIKTTD